MGGIRVKKTTLKDETNHSPDIVYEYSYNHEDGTSSSWGYESNENHVTKQIRHYSSDNHYPGKEMVDFVISIRKFERELSSWVKGVPGPEIGAGLSGHARNGFLKDLKQQFVIFFVSQLITAHLNPVANGSFTEYSFFPNWSFNPRPFMYSRVTEKNTSLSGGNGKIVYEYSKPANETTEILPNNFPFSAKSRFPSWKYGLPVKTTWYNNAGAKVKETEQIYNIIARTETSSDFQNGKVLPLTYTVAAHNFYTHTIPPADLVSEFYYPQTGRAELIEAKVRLYNSGGNYQEMITKYSYNNNYLISTVETRKSNGDKIERKRYYASDYAGLTGITQLKNANALTTEISDEEWLVRHASGERFLLDAKVYEQGILPNGEIATTKVYSMESEEPLAESVIGTHNPSLLLRNAAYFKEQEQFSYDNNGNLVKRQSSGQELSGMIYDHNNRFITAEILNGSQDDVAYSSFEGSNKGGWAYNTEAVREDYSPTGKKYFALNGHAITLAVNQNKKYILSFWARSSNVVISGITVLLVKTGPTFFGWTYYEYSVLGNGSAQNMSITGTDGIDELRFYPETARLKTYTYNPLQGKTSECDENNRIVYFEYDGLNRLKGIRDEQRNLIKAYNYNFKQ